MYISRVLFATAGVAVLAWATSASAQASSNGAALEEVVVTARKAQENVQDVPATVTAFGRVALRERPIVTPQDLRTVTPGLLASSNSRSATSVRFAIRGQSEADSILTTDSSVGVYMDDVYLPRTYGLKTTFFDVDRVEILKGPQGTLYGKNTTGGAIGIFSVKPNLSEVGGYVDVEAGDWQTVIAKAALNLPIIKDKLAVRVVGLTGTTEGFARSIIGTRLNAHEDRALRLHVLFKPVDNFSILATGAFTRSEGQRILFRTLQEIAGPGQREAGLLLGAPASTAATAGLQYTTSILQQQRRFVFGGTDTPPDRFVSWNGALTANWDVNDNFSLRSITGYQKFKRSSGNDIDNVPLPISTGRGWTRDKFFSEELQLRGELMEGRLRPLLGLYYSDEKGNESTSTVSLPITSANAANQFDIDVRNKTKGVYGQIIYDLTSDLSLTGGLRYAEEIRGVLPRNRVVRPTGVTCALPPSLIVGGVCAAHVPDLKFSNTTYSITAAYRVRPDLNLYATHRTGFRAGGWNVFSSITNGIFSFEPETVSDFEAGVKSELFDRRVRFNLAAYASKYKDIQKATNTFLPTGASVRQINNAASATIKGGEVQLTASPTRSVTLDVSGAYTDAHYDEFVVRNATGAVVEDRTDEPFEFPKWTFSVGANKKWDVPIGVISARADWYWTSKVIFTATSQLTSAEQVMKQDSYGLLAARVELQVPEHGLTVAILGRNLLDKDYLVGAIDVRSLGWSIGIPGEPRYVGVEIRKSFGGTE